MASSAAFGSCEEILSTRGLIVESVTAVDTTPLWCSHLDKPRLQRFNLLWAVKHPMPQNTAADLDEGGVESKEEGSLQTSPTFFLGETWLRANLVLHPSDEEEWSALYLKVCAGQEVRVLGSLQLSWAKEILDTDTKEKPMFSWKSKKMTISGKNVQPGLGWGFTQFFKPSYREETQLYFRAEVVVVVNIDATYSQHNQPKVLEDLTGLLSDGHNADVVLKVEREELRAHKAILCARSPVFKAMLASDMLEARSGVIELNSMNVATARALLSFIYAGKVADETMADTAEELLNAGAMFAMVDLKEACACALLPTLCVSNTGRLLLLACLHDVAILKAEALAFLRRNKVAVAATEEWKEAVACHSKIILEAVMEIF